MLGQVGSSQIAKASPMQIGGNQRIPVHSSAVIVVAVFTGMGGNLGKTSTCNYLANTTTLLSVAG